MRLARIVVVGVGALAAALPAPAGAATTVQATSNQLLIEAAPGEANHLRLTLQGEGGLPEDVVRVRDTHPLILETRGAAPACTRVSPTEAECPYPGGFRQPAYVVDLGDRADRLTIDTGVPSPEQDVGANLFFRVLDGPGDDRVTSVPTVTLAVNGPGDDVLRGVAETTPGGGDDAIVGNVGPDLLLGGAGRDTIRGGRGADVIRGGTGHDRLYGDSGQDRLFGGTGNDFLRGGSARDALFGGPGADVTIQG